MPKQPAYNLQYETVTITPEMATDWLNKFAYGGQRPLSDATVVKYAKDMKNGEWTVDGQAIAFGSNNKILNGQHRLWACIEAGVAFTTTVVRGVNPEAFKNYDSQKPRSAADVIASTGTLKYRRPIATASTLCLRYCGSGKRLNTASLTNREISNYFDDHPDIETWVELASRGVMRPYAAPLAAVLYLASHKYRARGLEFVERMVDGVGLEKGSPVLALRNRLMGAGRGLNTRAPTNERFALVIQAWNAHVEGRPLQRMQVFTGDKFPKIKGVAA